MSLRRVNVLSSQLRRVNVLSSQLIASDSLKPDTQLFCTQLNAVEGPKPWEVPIEAVRKNFDDLLKLMGHPDDAVCSTVTDINVPGPLDKIPVRYYRPSIAANDTILPVCLYMHGGGWTLGNVEAYDGFCRALCNSGKFAVVSVEYRLAPEYPMPSASDDCFAVLTWLAEGNLVGINTDKIAVAGDSAGGHLAAIMGHRARNVGISLQLQVMLCPVTDARMGQESYTLFSKDHFLTTETMAWFNNNYSRKDSANWLASPLLAPDDKFYGLAPALVVTASHDILRDEGIEYANKIKALSQTSVECENYTGQIHDFFLFPKAIKDASLALDKIAAAIARALQ